MNIARAYATHGFMDTNELTHLATLAESHSRILEVGSWMGRSARAFADNTAGTVHCVDTWADNAYGDAPAEITCHPDWLWKEFRKNHADTIEAGQVIPVRATSTEGARILSGQTFDLIFIDAGHNYEDVIADINAWRPLLAEGGLLCGHDLYPNGPYHPGVLQAVDELIGKYSIVGTIWSEG